MYLHTGTIAHRLQNLYWWSHHVRPQPRLQTRSQQSRHCQTWPDLRNFHVMMATSSHRHPHCKTWLLPLDNQQENVSPVTFFIPPTTVKRIKPVMRNPSKNKECLR
jgi:hypothetical protein